MTLTDLLENERLALVYLSKQLIWADREFSKVVTILLREMATAMGNKTWTELTRSLKDRLKSEQDVMDLVHGVERPEARTLIHTTLHKLAESDGLVEAEKEILDWVAKAWEI